ncbi:MAG: hypothetical protein WBG46_02235 [Nonlabens sp.]
MKNFKLLLLACVAVFAASCGGDDDGSGFELNQENIVAEYEIVFYESVQTEEISAGNSTVTAVTTIEGDTFTNARFFIDIDNTYDISGGYVEDLTTVVAGQETDSSRMTANFQQGGSYSLNTDERTLILNPGNDQTTLEITRFNENSLRLVENTEFPNGVIFEQEYRLERVDN